MAYQLQILTKYLDIIGSLDSPHIYSDAQGVVGHNYRLLRMEMILACEKELKRRLVPWEQEALLYPRMCADVWCRKWEQDALKDCERCGQVGICLPPRLMFYFLFIA